MSMNKELTPLEALEKLGIFRSYDLLTLNESILQLYIKIKGKKLTKIKKLDLESYYGEVYKVKNNTIYYQETYDPLADVPIKFSEDNWQEYGIIDFIGKKEEYEPKAKTIPMMEWKIIERKLKALEIIKEKQVDVGLLLDCETEPEYLNRCCNRYWHNEKCGWKRLSQEEFDLLKEVLK